MIHPMLVVDIGTSPHSISFLATSTLCDSIARMSGVGIAGMWKQGFLG